MRGLVKEVLSQRSKLLGQRDLMHNATSSERGTPLRGSAASPPNFRFAEMFRAPADKSCGNLPAGQAKRKSQHKGGAVSDRAENSNKP